MSSTAVLFVKTTITTTKQKQKQKQSLTFSFKSPKTSKNKKRQHPRQNGTGVENAMDLLQVDLTRIREHNVLATKA